MFHENFYGSTCCWQHDATCCKQQCCLMYDSLNHFSKYQGHLTLETTLEILSPNVNTMAEESKLF